VIAGKIKAKCLAFVVLAVAAAVVTPSRPAAAVDGPALAGTIVARHVVPRYRALADAAATFEGIVESACPAGDMPTLRAGFSTVMDAWMAVQHIRFGPAMREDRHVRVQYWPDKHNQLSRQLGRLLDAADDAALAPDRFAAATVALQGLQAIERLIHDDGATALRGGAFGCRLIDTIAANVQAIAAEALAEWQEFPANETAAEGLVDSLMTQLQVIGELKLLRPLGTDAASTRPRLAENWRSARSGRNIRINVEALADLYSGAAGADLRTAAAAADDGQGRLEALDDGFAVAVRTAARLDDGLAPDLADERRRRTVRFLAVHLSGLRELVAVTVAPAMGVTLGFNALDGD
jgi:hypothetical protein